MQRCRFTYSTQLNEPKIAMASMHEVAVSDLPEDPLSDYLHALQMRASIYASPIVCGDWRVNAMHHAPGASFHLVSHGAGWLHLKNGHKPQSVRAGDLLVFPRRAWHMLTAGPELTGTDTWSEVDSEHDVTGFVCGTLMFATQSPNPMLDALPDVLILSTTETSGANALEPLVRVMAVEAAHTSPGRQAVLDRLAEVLFVHMMRHVMESRTEATGLLAAMRDARIGRALAAFHRAPHERWQLDELAALAGMSRASFTSHFQRLVQVSPMQYLAHWRMLLAEVRLKTTRQSVAQIAEALGYETEAAFRKAFKRHRGIGPGALRRSAASAPSSD